MSPILRSMEAKIPFPTMRPFFCVEKRCHSSLVTLSAYLSLTLLTGIPVTLIAFNSPFDCNIPVIPVYGVTEAIRLS